jgi:hypothetical protein
MGTSSKGRGKGVSPASFLHVRVLPAMPPGGNRAMSRPTCGARVPGWCDRAWLVGCSPFLAA